MAQYNRGFCAPLTDGGYVIVLYDDPITEISNVFVSRNRVYEIVLTHELGHALGVPWNKSHKWSGNHCTHPNCAMYPSPDIRAIWSVILNGNLPDDYCDECQQELKQD